MAQNIWNTIIPTSTSGSQLATLLNDFKDAVISGFSGTARPTELDPGGYWIDTTLAGSPDFTWVFKIWTGTVDVEIFRINLSTGTAGLPGTTNEFKVERVSANTTAAWLTLLKERVANNGQVLTDDVIGDIRFVGAASDNTNPVVARIRAVALDDMTASENGGYISFEATDINTTALYEMMRIINGRIGIGGITAPAKTLHVRGDNRFERRADDANPLVVEAKKLRIAGGGQVLNNDVIASFRGISTDGSGADAEAAEIRIVAKENHTSSAQGSEVQVRLKKIGQNTYTTQMVIGEEITFNAPVTGTTATFDTLNVTTLNAGTTTTIDDPQIIINDGGTEAAAQSASSGIKWSFSDADDYVLRYNNTLQSRLAFGVEGSEVEVATVSASQTFSNKTLQDYRLSQQDVATASTIASLNASRAIVNFTGSTATDLQGIDATGATRVILLHNDSTANVTLKHENAGATATNRIFLPNALDIILEPQQSVELFYSTVDTRWKLKSGSGTGSGGGALAGSTQSVANNGTISITTTDQRQVVYLSSTSGLLDLNLTPFGGTGGWKNNMEVWLVGNSATNVQRLLPNDAAFGVVGNIGVDGIEITLYRVVKLLWNNTAQRFIYTGGA